MSLKVFQSYITYFTANCISFLMNHFRFPFAAEDSAIADSATSGWDIANRIADATGRLLDSACNCSAFATTVD